MFQYLSLLNEWEVVLSGGSMIVGPAKRILPGSPTAPESGVGPFSFPMDPWMVRSVFDPEGYLSPVLVSLAGVSAATGESAGPLHSWTAPG